MQKYKNFNFEKFTFDKVTLVAIFYYNFDNELFFEEKIDFSSKNFFLREKLDFDIIDNILFHIHIALGISYYKFYLTPNLVIKSGKLDEFQVNFWKKFYLNGLGEFLYRNNINPFDLNFVSKGEKKFAKKDFKLECKLLVPIGGGKDSIVSIEFLKKMKKEFDLFTFGVNDNILYENTVKISRKKRLFIKRKLSKNIMEIIDSGAYNGHIPITGIIAFVLNLVSYLYDYKYILLSNEFSANFGNTLWNNIEINHQWSKSLEFEKDFRKYTKKYIGEIKYFSLLRPFYEIKIAEIFSKVGKKYFTSFSSCNTNFKIFKKTGEKKETQNFWCNSCPKCIFVYIILRPFLTKKETLDIFKEELYEKKEILENFKNLAGISGIKPFECVGTKKEVVLAMKMHMEKCKQKLPFVLDTIKKDINLKLKNLSFEDLKLEFLTPNFENNIIPEKFIFNLKNVLKYEEI